MIIYYHVVVVLVWLNTVVKQDLPKRLSFAQSKTENTSPNHVV
jgi:hypothetical protein